MRLQVSLTALAAAMASTLPTYAAPQSPLSDRPHAESAPDHAHTNGLNAQHSEVLTAPTTALSAASPAPIAATANSAAPERRRERDIEEINITGTTTRFGATKSDIPILETSRSVSVITDQQFLDRGALTLDDTLLYTAGVVGDAFGFATRGDFPTVRGLDVPEYLDNIQALFGFTNNARSDIYTLEQVEVLKGPASVLYGQGSPGGILNTVSKRASQDNDTRELVLDYGTHDRKQIAADIGVNLSDTVSARLVALYRDSGTQVDFVNDDAIVLAPSLTFENDSTQITALINFTDRNSDTAGQFLPLLVSGCADTDVTISEPALCAGATGQQVDNSVYVGEPAFNRYDTQSFSATLFAVQDITDQLTFEATARYRDGEANYRQTWISFLGAGTPRVTPSGDAFGRTWYDAPATSEQYAVDARLRGQFKTGIFEHEALAGVHYQDAETATDAANLYALPTSFNIFSPVYDASEIPSQAAFDAVRVLRATDTETLGFYINDQITAGRFVFNAGIRFDDVSTSDGTTTQDDKATTLSFGALYKTDIGLNPYVSYAESFLPVVGIDTVTNQPLNPQEGKQWEFGLKYQPAGSRTYITAAYFDIEQSNLPNPADLPGANTQQEGIASIKGFETELHTQMGDFTLDAAFSYTDAEDPDGTPFPSLPKRQASAWLMWVPSAEPYEGLRIGAGARYASANPSNGTSFIAANGFAATPLEVVTSGYTVFDALIGYDFGDFDLSVNVRNLLGKDYYSTCLARGDCFSGETRTLVARLSYSF